MVKMQLIVSTFLNTLRGTVDPLCAVNHDWGSLSDLRRGGAKFYAIDHTFNQLVSKEEFIIET